MTHSVYDRYSADSFITILRLFDKENKLKMKPVRQSTLDPEFHTPSAHLDLPLLLYPSVSEEEAVHMKVAESGPSFIVCYETIKEGTLIWITDYNVESGAPIDNNHHVGKVKHVIYNEQTGEWCIGYAKPVFVNRKCPYPADLFLDFYEFSDAEFHETELHLVCVGEINSTIYAMKYSYSSSIVVYKNIIGNISGLYSM
jgi:hypothetical protein